MKNKRLEIIGQQIREQIIEDENYGAITFGKNQVVSSEYYFCLQQEQIPLNDINCNIKKHCAIAKEDLKEKGIIIINDISNINIAKLMFNNLTEED